MFIALLVIREGGTPEEARPGAKAAAGAALGEIEGDYVAQAQSHQVSWLYSSCYWFSRGKGGGEMERERGGGRTASYVPLVMQPVDVDSYLM